MKYKVQKGDVVRLRLPANEAERVMRFLVIEGPDVRPGDSLAKTRVSIAPLGTELTYPPVERVLHGDVERLTTRHPVSRRRFNRL